ncbi:hypothetical protein [Brevundimonas nasdae]|uniref:hypothetical protein n=1 Tax=Brevundimonas nasdae TaxID=172043 RepID=UPI003F691C83
MYLRTLGAVAAVSTLAACTFNANLPKSDPALNAEAQAFYGDLAAGQDEALLARMSSKNDAGAIRAQIPMLRNIIGNAPIPEPKVVGFQSVTSTQGRFYRVQQDYAYPDRVAHVETNFVKEGDGWKVLGFNVNITMTAAPGEATI